MTFSNTYRGLTVLVTGHTGFKGAWLCQWLHALGANVVGLALIPDTATDFSHTTPSHFKEANVQNLLAEHIESDIRDPESVSNALAAHQPDIVFHLAAQPLVLRGYEAPMLTVNTNVIGTLNVLEAVRRQNRGCSLVMITTDKVYENVGWLHAYREVDTLGGHDPYSASKACAEILISSYMQSFFSNTGAADSALIAVAPVRGGNVIGGGDWAENRIVPDAVRALSQNRPIVVRNPLATRPWQHVLDLLSGYLHLGSILHRRRTAAAEASAEGLGEALSALRTFTTPFNFGPLLTSNRPVKALIAEILKHWPGSYMDVSSPDAPVEAGKLNLTIDKAYHMLGWQPKWDFETTIRHTVEWYRGFYGTAQGHPERVRALTRSQIEAYSDGLAYDVE